MLLPIKTSIQPRRTPYTNYALIIVNIVIFILTYSPRIVEISGVRTEEPLRAWAHMFMLTPVRPHIWQFVTYAFLHGSIMHIFGNMYFLFVFGNNVNDKLGNIGYLCLYLAGAVFAGLGHTILHAHPVLGASGAVAAITGAYLVLFPQTVITVIYWFIFIGTVDISALYFIAFKLIVWDNIVEPRFSPDAVAYDAHLAGYAAGMAAVALLLATKLIRSDHTDLYGMFRQWNRRRRFRDATADGYDPFVGRNPRKPVDVKVVEPDPTAAVQNQQIIDLRNEIAALINSRNLAQAAEKYLQLIALDPQQVLARQHQLDVANQLMSMGKWTESASAYEVFLGHYSTYEYVEQVRLMLGILYSRYLKKTDLAVQQLHAARDNLTDPGQIRLCTDELAKLRN
jgi:membrane associated rhomboid family serine protease